MDKETNNNKTTTAKQGKKNYFALYNKVFDELSKHYPKLLIKDKPLLLKVVIHRDIFKDCKLSVSKREVRKFLYCYVNSKTYQELHIENAVRYDLLGEESGVVTKENLDLMAKRKEERKKMISTEKLEKEKAKKDKADKFNQNNNKN